MTTIEFDVLGLPVPQGSMRAFVRGGRACITHDKGADLNAWREAIRHGALDARRGAGLLDTPIKVDLRFRLPRPRGHYGKRGLLPSAPGEPTRKPDLDKLVRAALDALTNVLFGDDSQVVELHVRKVYTDSPTAIPGAEIVVSEVLA